MGRRTVTLSIGSQPNQMLVAERLQREGMLKRIIAFPKGVEIFDPSETDGLKIVRRYKHYRVANRILWAAWRRLPGSSRAWNLPIVFSTCYADRLAARWIEPCTIFHGWTGNCLASVKKARKFGAHVIIEQATMHPQEWQRTVLDECTRFGVRAEECRALLPHRLIRRMEREYSLADRIVVPSAIARRSFETAGLGAKVVVVHAGVAHDFFRPPERKEARDPFRVCFVGRVEIAKGVPYLLKAWEKLQLHNSELVLIGQVASEMRSFLHSRALPNVRLTGELAASEVAEWYRRSHLFVFPSINEGLARSIMEAMGSGLPVIATELSGAADCITPGVEGLIVPERDADAIADSILLHYQSPDLSMEMGRAARARIESEFTLQHYVERVMEMYRAVGELSTQHG